MRDRPNGHINQESGPETGSSLNLLDLFIGQGFQQSGTPYPANRWPGATDRTHQSNERPNNLPNVIIEHFNQESDKPGGPKIRYDKLGTEDGVPGGCPKTKPQPFPPGEHIGPEQKQEGPQNTTKPERRLPEGARHVDPEEEKISGPLAPIEIPPRRDGSGDLTREKLDKIESQRNRGDRSGLFGF